MEAVYEGDEYGYRGRFAEPMHVRSSDPNRRSKPLQHAYVLAAFAGGIIKCFSWSRAECIAHRNAYSQGWKFKPQPDNLWHEDNPAFWVMCCKTVLRNAINRGEIPISLRDNRGQTTLAAIPDDDSPTFQSPAGFDEPIVLPPQESQPDDFDPEREWADKIRAAGTADDAKDFARQATDEGYMVADVLQLRLTELEAGKAKRGQRANTLLDKGSPDGTQH
jgi:hypothetical protein